VSGRIESASVFAFFPRSSVLSSTKYAICQLSWWFSMACIFRWCVRRRDLSLKEYGHKGLRCRGESYRMELRENIAEIGYHCSQILMFTSRVGLVQKLPNPCLPLGKSLYVPTCPMNTRPMCSFTGKVSETDAVLSLSVQN